MTFFLNAIIDLRHRQEHRGEAGCISKDAGISCSPLLHTPRQTVRRDPRGQWPHRQSLASFDSGGAYSLSNIKDGMIF
jgi:hypothetical protein